MNPRYFEIVKYPSPSMTELVAIGRSTAMSLLYFFLQKLIAIAVLKTEEIIPINRVMTMESTGMFANAFRENTEGEVLVGFEKQDLMIIETTGASTKRTLNIR